MIAERTLHVCETCGETFEPTRRDGRYCKSACRQKAYRDRQAPAGDDPLVDAVWSLRAEGSIDGEEAILLLVAPPAEVLERLGVAA